MTVNTPDRRQKTKIALETSSSDEFGVISPVAFFADLPQ